MNGAVMERQVTISSSGVELPGTMYFPEQLHRAAPGVVLCHGFAGQTAPDLARHLCDLGMVALVFKFRGFDRPAQSPVTLHPSQQVADLQAAVSFLATRPEVDVARIGVLGSSLGGSIAILAAAVDDRIRACVAACPIGVGERWLQAIAGTHERWTQTRRSADRARSAGEPMHRFDIVPIPEDLRGHLPSTTPMEFSAETFFALRELNAENQIGRISPRPLLLMHAADDRVVACSESDELALLGGPTTDYERLTRGDHFITADPEAQQLMADWLHNHLHGEFGGTRHV